MWSLGFLLLFGISFPSQQSNGHVLPEEKRWDRCLDILSRAKLVVLPNRHYITNGKRYFSNIKFAKENDPSELLSQTNGGKWTHPDLDSEDSLREVFIPGWVNGAMAQKFILYHGYRNAMKIPTSQDNTAFKIIPLFPIPGSHSFNMAQPSLNIPKNDKTENGDGKLVYTDIFKELQAQEAEEARKEEAIKAEEAKKPEESEKAEEARNAEEVTKSDEANMAESLVPESEGPQNRINYPIKHSRNTNKNFNINSNKNSRRHKWG